MAINKKLINFAKKSDFDSKLANNEILNTSIVFIDDTKQIWTHGTLFCPTKVSDLTADTIIILPVHAHISTSWPDLTADGDSHSHTVNGSTITEKTPDAAWLLSGSSGLLKDLGDGSYLIQISHVTNNDNEGGLYTGYFSYTAGSGTDEEIILHRANNTSSTRLYAKIKYINNGTYLMLSALVDEPDCTGLTIKIKKLL